MPQFYSGITQSTSDRFNGSGLGQVIARSMYGNIANDIFQGQPEILVSVEVANTAGYLAPGSQLFE